ncbi:MAG: hypothetical protein RBR77_07450 [Thauera sp.]|jgi:hypothetical protein|nr:hypothetical protein [Thauera sp.]
MKNPIRHPRTRIREEVATLLAAHLPAVDPRLTASRISIHRSTLLFAAKLPAILIYTRDERIERAAEEADILAQAVEFVMETNETLGNTVDGIRQLGTEIDQDGESDTPILAARLMFEVSYWTQAPELPLTPEQWSQLPAAAQTPTTQLPAPPLVLADVVAWAREYLAAGGTLTPDVIAGWQAHLDERYWKHPSEVLGSWAPKIGIPHEPDYQDIEQVKGDVDVSDLPGILMPGQDEGR